ncbi:tetratricopeptide repeat protein [Paracrocinitomix mangrovi]|uniref:tetratricopeptide repeat protein n=1 Tax=Paracrocinitomix mangrovi TaxID=2862509 RepID=UPI001C8D18DC|nr:tetratricopeptide repeat protein [Paracrocinitomix mangrovi]UKN01660.1 tetratricopeptide repeat protein [Paracrocinitomix mangrovi]
MAKKKEATQDELTNLTATENFFDKYKRPLMIAGGVLIVFIVGIIVYQKFVVEPKVEESQDVYWDAFYLYEEGDTTELAYQGNDQIMGFIDIASEYDGTPAGEIASYALGTHAMEKGQWDEALSYLDDCDFDDMMVGTLVIGLKGDCYVELEQYSDAVEMFEKAADREPNEFTSPMFLKKAGLVYEKLEDNENAVVAYQRIKDEWPEAPVAADIDKYITRAQG